VRLFRTFTLHGFIVSGIPLVEALMLAFGGGIVSMVTALISNAVLFITVAPRIIAMTKRMVISKPKEYGVREKGEENL